MRITKRTNIAMRLLMFCAANADRLVTKTEVAECCGTSENHLAQVVNQLSQLDYLKTQRGRRGGLKLARPASDINVGSLFRELEGNLPLTECFAEGEERCPLVSSCWLRLALADAAEAFYQRLDEVSLDALVCDNVDLVRLLSPTCAHAQATA